MPNSHAVNFCSTYSANNDLPYRSNTHAHDAYTSVHATTPPHSCLSSLLLLNASSLNPSVNSASRWKLHDLIGDVEEKRESGQLFPFIVITESWLKSYFSDAQLQVPGYSISHCDRSKKNGVGVYSIRCHLSQSQLQRVLTMVLVRGSVTSIHLRSYS